MNPAVDAIRRLAGRRGVDLDALNDGEPSLDRRGWVLNDPVAWRVEQAEKILAHDLRGTFANARVDHPKVIDWVRRHLADPDAHPWLTLVGMTGRGKTHQACGVVRELALAAARANRRCRWRMVTHPELTGEMRIKPDGSHAWALERYLAADLLLFDDLGGGSAVEFSVEAVLNLVNERYLRRRATVYTTNLNSQQLSAMFGDRVLSRLSEGTVVVVDGPDRRPQRGEWR